MIYASLHSDICGGGQLFNVADNETPSQYGKIWPHLARWFGLIGVEPPNDSSEASNNNTLKVGQLPETTSSLSPGEYVAKYKETFDQRGRSKASSRGVGAGSRQLDSVGYWLTFDRQMSLGKLRGTVFEGDKDPVQGWLDSFEMFRKAGLVL